MRHRSCCCASVITDGGAQLYDGDVQTTRRTRQAAAYEKAQGIVVLAIGAGEGVNAVELAAMASEPKARRWTTLGSFHSLRRLSEELAGSCVPEIQDGEKDVLELCPRSFDVFLQVGFIVENPKPKQQVEQGLNMDRINEINDWFWNPV